MHCVCFMPVLDISTYLGFQGQGEGGEWGGKGGEDVKGLWAN